MQPVRSSHAPPPVTAFQPSSTILVVAFPLRGAAALAAPLWPYLGLILLFVFAGLGGHDPWKADEAYVFGVVQHMLESGDWVVPTLAGDPFMEKPPLFYWVSVLCARAFTGVLPLHDAARMACALFMLLACGALAATARAWWGKGAGRLAVLALIACFGTLVQSHMMMPDIPLLAGFALSALGFARVQARPVAGGAWMGLGFIIAFLAKGLLGPAVMGATALLLPLLFAQWRTPAYWRGLAVAAAVGAPCCLIWPIALYLRSPVLFMDWFWINNIGRFIGFSVPQLGTEHLPWFWTQTIPWFTFPALPVALYLLWQRRATALTESPVQYALVAFGVLMTVLGVSSSGRAVYAWPLLLPIALLAAPASARLPALLDRVWAWLGIALFGFLSLGVWSGWIIMMVDGRPPSWHWLQRLLPSTFQPRFDAAGVALALLVTVAAVPLLRWLRTRPARGLSTWVVGLTCAWTLLAALWMPWLDFAKSYRSVFMAMPIPAQANCVASYNLGEGERAMLRYVTGRNPMRLEVHPGAGCDTLLVQREAAYGEPEVDLTRWKERWRGSRPGVTNERFFLFTMK